MLSGNIIDAIRLDIRRPKHHWPENIRLIDTKYGQIRIQDTGGRKPVIINTPDGPNVIEHHQQLIASLSKNFRVVCFEFPGVGFSYPSKLYRYSFDQCAELILDLMTLLKIDTASLAFSCSNGYYAIKVAERAPDRFNHAFLAQTASLPAMMAWGESTIPKILKIPVVGQIACSLAEKKLAHTWYKYALPKNCDAHDYREKALMALGTGGCFCLSSLVQSIARDRNHPLNNTGVSTTLVWGNNDYSHRMTDSKSLLKHVPQCEIVTFDGCGHFPDLERTHDYVRLIHERLRA